MGTVNYTVFEGEILEENRDGTIRDYVPDPQGNTVALLDASQNITDTWSYWPYGEVRSHTGPSPTPFTFIGVLGYRKDPTGLTYVRARYYNAPNGQWITADRLWPQEQAYAYVRQNPVNNSDPSGLGVRICSGPLVLGVQVPAGPFKTTSHWFVQTDIPGCGSIGYGPSYGMPTGGIRLDDPDFNSNRGYAIDCQELKVTAAQERCICDNAKNAANGWIMCGTTWNDPPKCGDYNFFTHNCQDFILCLLTEKCGVGIPAGYQRGSFLGPLCIPVKWWPW